MIWAFDTSAISQVATDMGIRGAVIFETRPPAAKVGGRRSNAGVLMPDNNRVTVYGWQGVVGTTEVIVHELAHCLQQQAHGGERGWVAHKKQVLGPLYRDKKANWDSWWEREARAVAAAYDGPPLVRTDAARPKSWILPTLAMRQLMP